MIIIGLVVAGAVGAVLRSLVDQVVQRRWGQSFPLGILVVNVTGCFALGVLAGSAAHHGVSAAWLTVAGTGCVGAYTTFSTFSFDTVQLAEHGERGLSVLNVVISLTLGLAAASLGLALGSLT